MPAASSSKPDKTPRSDTPPPIAAQKANPDGEDAPLPGFGEQISGLVADGRAWAETEIAFHKERIAYGTHMGKAIGTRFGIAALLLLSGIITLLLGVFMVVAYYFNPLIAIASVPTAYMILAFILYRSGRSQIKKLGATIRETGGITGRKTETGSDDG